MRVRRQPRRRLPTVCLLIAVTLATVPAAASAEDVGHKIIRLCTTGQSLAGYPQSAYAKALKEISATTEEYSGCGQEIRAAMAAAAQSHGSSPTGQSATPTAPVTATPSEQRSLASAASAAGGGPVRVDGEEIDPGVVHANVASAFSTLPTPLLVLLAFLLACLLAFGARLAHRRIGDRRGD